LLRVVFSYSVYSHRSQPVELSSENTFEVVESHPSQPVDLTAQKADRPQLILDPPSQVN